MCETHPVCSCIAVKIGEMIFQLDTSVELLSSLQLSKAEWELRGERACGQQPGKTPKSEPGNYPTVVGFYYHTLFVARELIQLPRAYTASVSASAFCRELGDSV